MTLTKILLSIIGIILLSSIALITIFVVTFDANEYKSNVSSMARKETGRQLDFDGDVSLTLYPALGMKLGAMTLQNAPGFGNAPMLEVKQASVSVDVASLLTMQPKIDRLVLQGLTLRLQKNRQGKTNWDDLVKVKSDSSDDANSASKDQTATGSSKGGLKLAGTFGGLDVSDVKVLWQDASTQQNYDLHVERLSTGKIAEGETFPVELKLALQSAEQLSATLELQAEALLSAQKINLSVLQLAATASGSLLPVDSAQLKLIGKVDYSLASKKLDISGFNTQVTTRGGILTASDTSLSGVIGFDMAHQKLTIAALDIHSKLSGESVPQQEMTAQISSRELAMNLPRRAVDLQDVVIALNDDRFKGFISIADYARPDVRFELAAQSIDVDDLLGKKTAAAAPPAASTEAAKDIQIKLPMALLHRLKLDGKISIAQLKAQGLTLNDVLLKLEADQGRVTAKPISISLYDGTLDGEFELNAQGQQPVYRIRQRLNDFHIGEFLQDFMQDDMISGKANLNIALTSQGEWLSKLKSNLNGDISLKVLDGSLKGFNLRQKIKTAQARLKQQKPPKFEPEVTDFSSLQLSATIHQGVLNTDDLDMQAPLMRVGGKGSVNLVQETVDYLVNAKLVATTKGQQGGSADELAGITIPVLIKGPWTAPDFDVQLDEVFKARLEAKKAQIRESVAQQKAKVKQQLEAQKQKLKAAQQKELAARKLQLQKQQELAAAKEKARLKAAEDKKRAELEAAKKKKQDAAKKKLEDKLKKLF